MTLAISICATRAYTYAMHLQARRVQQCVALAKVEPGHIILSGDNSQELLAVKAMYCKIMPEGWKIHHLISVPDDPALERPHKNRDAEAAKTPEQKKENAARKARAFRRIGDMREAAHAYALKLGVEHCWSLDSDVLPPPNALRASLSALAWDGRYYDIAFCLYPNLLLLGGLGEPGHPMNEDFLPHERALPAWLRAMLERAEARMKTQPNQQTARLRERIHAHCRRFGPDGSIWQVIAKYGWRRRGWFDHAYPGGIGKGAMVPVDWCGFGCTLMTWEALALADFAGFEGHSTEDIHVIAHRWQPAELRIAGLPHCLCDHLHMTREKGVDRINYLRMYHEAAGECRGHVRIESRPFVGQTTNPTAPSVPAVPAGVAPSPV